MFSRNFLSAFEIKTIKTSEGRTIDVVAISEPSTPAVLKPANVAILIPIGPGVIDEIAIILLKSSKLYQL